MALGSRWRWTAAENTFSPKTLAPGCVRSAWPSAPPLGLHWAAWTLAVRVRVGIGSCVLLLGQSWVGGQPRPAPAPGPCPCVQRSRTFLRPGARARPDGETPSGNLRHGDNDPSSSSKHHSGWMEHGRGGLMRRRTGAALLGAALACAALPGAAYADSLDAAGKGALPDSVAINSIWVVVAALLVIWMQAGFAFLEIGFSRAKNAGTVVAKILVNFSIAAILYYAVGFAFAFGNGDIIGHAGFFLRDYGDPQQAFGVMGLSDATIGSKWLFQFSFCAVSLAIVWGTTLERIKYSAYVIYAIVFASVIYPIGSHWVFGGGWLQVNVGMQDFAGSTARQLVGANGAPAARLLLGPRTGKSGADGKPRAIPGHSMPLAGLGVLILFIGWFGFNPGSTLNATDTRFAEICVVTLMGACGGVLGAFVMTQLKQRTIDIGMVANGAVAGLVAITAPSGYVEIWAR